MTRPGLIIFTDLDGTLLDHATYRWNVARPALTRCKTTRVPVVLVSSKTRAELDWFRKELGLSDPFVSENGGGVFFPRDSFPDAPPGAVASGELWKWVLGIPYAKIVRALRAIREELGWDMLGFSDMPPDEIVRLTELDQTSAERAARREFDEPFLIRRPLKPDERRLSQAAADRGLLVTRGGRFYHLMGGCDKGNAVERLITWYRSERSAPLRSVALGDSPNDYPMLARADIPILVRSRQSFRELRPCIPHLAITRETGPAGWNTAVLETLAKEEEPAYG